MSIAKRFNNEVVKFTFDAGDDFEFKTLEELYKANGKEQVYEVKGLFINTKSKFGDNPVVVAGDCYISLPNHLVDTVKEIRQDAGLVDDINNGKVGLEIYEYNQPKYNRTCYSINWLDI